MHFDVVLDITAYCKEDIESLLDVTDSYDDYIFVSSGAVYPETNSLPFNEEQECGENRIWGEYGLKKLDAERYLQERVPNSYILRPPYIYGKMQNLYREGFPFECAEKDRSF